MKSVRVTVRPLYGSDDLMACLNPITLEELENPEFVLLIGRGIQPASVKSSDDVSRGEISLSPSLRDAINVSIGETIEVRSASPQPARKITLARSSYLDEGILDYLKKECIGLPALKGSTLFMELPNGRVSVKVEEVEPQGVVVITEKTQFQLSAPVEETPILDESVYRDLWKYVFLPLSNPEIYRMLGLKLPKGVLFYGPPGTGKTMTARWISRVVNARFHFISGPEFLSPYVGESERRLRDIFRDAREHPPAIIYFDEIDSIAPKREETMHGHDIRVISTLLSEMDGIGSGEGVIVIGSTNRVNEIDPALRRPGRFDREIEFRPPNKDLRLRILQQKVRGLPLKGVDLRELASRTHGYTGADLSELVRQAALNALSRLVPVRDITRGLGVDERVRIIYDLSVIWNDFERALSVVKPSSMREFLAEVPDVSMEDVGGLENAKKLLKEAVAFILRSDLFQNLKIRPGRGILLYGPPGTGKTLLAKAAAHHFGLNFISVKGPEILSMWFGESERAVREIFKRARQVAPSIVFFDEIDSIAQRRGTGHEAIDRVVNQLLTEMDGLSPLSGVLVMAATNRPDMLDTALLRPGRFDYKIFVGLPDLEARKEILRIKFSGLRLEERLSMEEIARETEGYSGADLEALVREALRTALEEAGFFEGRSTEIPVIRRKHIQAALTIVKPSVSKEIEREMREYIEHLSQ